MRVSWLSTDPCLCDIRRLQAAQKVVSKLSKKMRPCYTFSKFGDCKKPQCPFLHPGGALLDGVWRKEAAAPEKPQASAAKEEPAGITAGAGDKTEEG